MTSSHHHPSNNREIDEPRPCFVALRLVRGGPPVAARIFLRLGILAAEINGESCDPMRVWHGGEFISEDEYHTRLANPPPDPDKPIDWRARETPF